QARFSDIGATGERDLKSARARQRGDGARSREKRPLAAEQPAPVVDFSAGKIGHGAHRPTGITGPLSRITLVGVRNSAPCGSSNLPAVSRTPTKNKEGGLLSPSSSRARTCRPKAKRSGNRCAAVVRFHRDRGVSRVLGIPLVADGSGNCRNSDLPIAELKRQIFAAGLPSRALAGSFLGRIGRNVVHSRTPIPVL